MSLLPKDPSVNVCVQDTGVNKNASNPKAAGNGETAQDMDSNGNSNSMDCLVVRKDTFMEHAKRFIPVIKRIVRRPLLVFYMLFLTLELACIGVFATFIVKYFRIEFAISGKRAAFLNGAVLIPAAILGLNVSAFVCRQFRLTLKQCGMYVLANNILTVSLLVAATFVGCKNPPIAGVNNEYATSLDSMDCNFNCGCNSNIFRPVCGADDVSYLSPCNAGCQIKDLSNNTYSSTYSDCTCVQEPPTSTFDDYPEFGSAKSGLCDREDSCETNLYIAVFLLGCLAFCRFQDNAPISLILLGNTETETRTVTLGLTKFVQNIFGYFPTPIYFGEIVNSTCTLWQYTCGERGACWLYDIVKLRYALFGLNIALRMLQIPVCIGIILTVKEYLTKESPDEKSPSDYAQKDVDDNTTKQ
ncbi:solute carrier organic anion transporter family member 4C1-like [Amphiura filiformis]|uniref:solute carrier organic anion transporter family member 4C1-like n=1 Tax=Amphiura filiformis TaxID=82378 RepID=UPI003B222F0C